MFSLTYRISSVPSRRLALLGCAAIGSIVSLFASQPAHAALLSTGACSEAAVSTPFQRWGDTNRYELMPQGDFEGSLSQWTLTGGAHAVAGSESFGVSGKVGTQSMSLPAGSSAQSPFVCVNAGYPTFRFFAHNSNILSTVVASVLYKTVLGTAAVPLGVAALSTSWQPTLPMLTGSVVAGLLSGGTAQVSLRFTALTGSSQIDDIYVDPRMR